MPRRQRKSKSIISGLIVTAVFPMVFLYCTLKAFGVFAYYTLKAFSALVDRLSYMRIRRQTSKARIPKKMNIRYHDIDTMSGHDFEYLCAKLLKDNGYTNVIVTQGSGDRGVDITCAKNGIKYAIQCKRFKQNVSRKAIQEIYTGKAIYKCDVGIVLTNNNYTSSAMQDARALGIELWGSEKLMQLIRHSRKEEKSEKIDQAINTLKTSVCNIFQNDTEETKPISALKPSFIFDEDKEPAGLIGGKKAVIFCAIAAVIIVTLWQILF